MITHPTPPNLSEPESYRGRVSELISKSSTETVPTGLSLTAGRINRLLGSFVLATFVIYMYFKRQIICSFTGANTLYMKVKLISHCSLLT